MQIANEFRIYSEECLRIAGKLSDVDKRTMIEMSAVWALLAVEREMQIGGQEPGTGPFPSKNERRKRVETRKRDN